MSKSIVASLGCAVLGTAFVVSSAAAQDFALQVGPPVAAAPQATQGAPVKKDSLLFVVRPGGCPASAQITATAEGIVNGARQSVTLKLTPLATSGAHAVPRDMPNRGVWVVSLVGTCAGKTAGAIVAMMGPKQEYRREGVTLLARAATPDEIDASLKVLTTGGQK